MVVVGIDSHKDSLAGCVIDEVGRPLEYRSFANTAAGYPQALEWVRQFDAGRVAIEGSGGYGRPLALVLVAAGIEVVDVPPQDGCSGPKEPTQPPQVRSLRCSADREGRSQRG